MKKNYITPFIRTQKQKNLLMKVTFMMNLNQSIVLLYKTQKFLGDGSGWIMDSFTEHNFNISKHNP